MLVLTIKEGESFFIGDNVEVKLIENNGRQSKIGIIAPREIAVDRAVFRQRKQEKTDAKL